LKGFYPLFTLMITGITTGLRSSLTTTKGQRNPKWEAMIPPGQRTERHDEEDGTP